MGSSFIHLIRTDSNEFFLMAEQYSTVYMYHIFFTHSSVHRHLGCFHVLAVVNSAAVNTGVHVSFSVVVFSGYMVEKETETHSGILAQKFPWTEEPGWL